MAVVTLTHKNRTLEDAEEISTFLARFGIWYRRFEGIENLDADASNEQILAAFDEPIRKLKVEGGYVTADVINIDPETPSLRPMLDKFNKEHWHDEDEVRFIVGGRGVFHIHPKDEPVFRLEVVKGDMINVPNGTWHWFDLCEEQAIRCIRLFQDPSGWTPQYTKSGEDARHEPLCFGPAFIPPLD